MAEDPSVLASGHTVFDLGLSKRLTRRMELSLSVDNLTNRDYYETQNYFESRVTPDAPVMTRIHATPAYLLTAVIGLTLRFGGGSAGLFNFVVGGLPFPVNLMARAASAVDCF